MTCWRGLRRGLARKSRLQASFSLRAEARLAKLVQQITRNSKPYAFDQSTESAIRFLDREWKVLTADGTNVAGNSKIELILGTADPENRTTAGNIYQGESLNIYHAGMGTALE